MALDTTGDFWPVEMQSEAADFPVFCLQQVSFVPQNVPTAAEGESISNRVDEFFHGRWRIGCLITIIWWRWWLFQETSDSIVGSQERLHFTPQILVTCTS